jgi:hypothetical protein
MAKEHGGSNTQGSGTASGRCGCCQPSHEEIANRAYDLWLARGVTQRHEADAWLVAECELRQARHGQWHGVAA